MGMVARRRLARVLAAAEMVYDLAGCPVRGAGESRIDALSAALDVERVICACLAGLPPPRARRLREWVSAAMGEAVDNPVEKIVRGKSRRAKILRKDIASLWITLRDNGILTASACKIKKKGKPETPASNNRQHVGRRVDPAPRQHAHPPAHRPAGTQTSRHTGYAGAASRRRRGRKHASNTGCPASSTTDNATKCCNNKRTNCCKTATPGGGKEQVAERVGDGSV